MWFLMLLYAFVIVLLLVYLALTQVEYFAVQDVSEDEKLCFQCMTYFQDVFQLSNPDDIVPYVKSRIPFIESFIDSYSSFIESDIAKCTKKDAKITTAEVISCFAESLNTLVKDCQKTHTYADCLVARTLGERILKDASMCGTSACSTDEFVKKFKDTLATMKEEFYKCKMGFQKVDDTCVKFYANVLKTKLGTPLEERDEDVPLTSKQIEEKLSEMATFAMTMT